MNAFLGVLVRHNVWSPGVHEEGFPNVLEDGNLAIPYVQGELA